MKPKLLKLFQNNLSLEQAYTATNFTLEQARAGFTIIELLVVLAIMGLITTLFLVNFAGLRGPRNLKIAQNELVSNFRKVQSYTISARNTPGGTAVKYYYVDINSLGAGSANKSYQIKAIDKNNSVSAVESITLPQGVVIQSLQATSTSGTTITPITCAQVGFSLPFGTVYIAYDQTLGACNANLAGVTANPTSLATSSNLRLDITLQEQATGTKGIVSVNGISGSVSSQ